MVIVLRVFFLVVFATMLAVTGWASAHVALWSIPASVSGHPWFVATLCDAYWGFLTFYLWIVYREPVWAVRGLWLVAVLLLGNMAMAAYALTVLFRVPVDAAPEAILLRGRPTSPLVPAALIAVFLIVAAAAAVA